MDYEEFAHWVAHYIFFDEIDDGVFTELACRKLYKLGVIERSSNAWFYTTAEKEEDNGDTMP